MVHTEYLHDAAETKQKNMRLDYKTPAVREEKHRNDFSDAFRFIDPYPKYLLHLEKRRHSQKQKETKSYVNNKYIGGGTRMAENGTMDGF